MPVSEIIVEPIQKVVETVKKTKVGAIVQKDVPPTFTPIEPPAKLLREPMAGI